MSVNPKLASDVITPAGHGADADPRRLGFSYQMGRLICLCANGLHSAADYEQRVDAVTKLIGLLPEFVADDDALKMPSLPDGTVLSPNMSEAERKAVGAKIMAMSPEQRTEFMREAQVDSIQAMAQMFGKHIDPGCARSRGGQEPWPSNRPSTRRCSAARPPASGDLTLAPIETDAPGARSARKCADLVGWPRGVGTLRSHRRPTLEPHMTSPLTASTESLAGTVALVTGASSGIGEATARSLAAAGAAVALAARRRDRLEALADDVGAAGAKTLVLEADITDPGQAAAMVEQAVAELGRLDTVVNNAGVMLLGPATDAPHRGVGAHGRAERVGAAARHPRRPAPPAAPRPSRSRVG